MARRIQSRNERLQGHRTLDQYLRRMKAVVDDSCRLATTDVMAEETLQYCITRLESIERNLPLSGLADVHVTDLLPLIQELLCEFRKETAGNSRKENVVTNGNTVKPVYKDHPREVQNVVFRSRCSLYRVQSGYSAERSIRTRGAPRYNIPEQQLRFLVRIGFCIPQIAAMLHVSVNTVKRRFRAVGISLKDSFSQIGENELDEAVKEVTNGNQRIGPNAVLARLNAKNIKVQRWRVRASLHRVDPNGVALRSVQSVYRRNYKVAGPNSLWHIDGNMKLIRWRFAIHGGIDGFSRVIVFLKASSSNRKEVVTENFLKAVSIYNLPSRIRVDYGGENNDICHLMEILRGSSRGSAIRGKSVHNQRIERLWVDVWKGVSNVYYDLFSFLEEKNYLNIENDSHLWALHYVFLPRINKDIEFFIIQWNSHGLRTEHHLSPLQLFTSRTLELCNTNLTAIQDIFQSSENDNLETVAPTIENLTGLWEREAVQVPGIQCPLSQEHVDYVKEHIDPLSGDIGIEVYLQVIGFINENARNVQ